MSLMLEMDKILQSKLYKLRSEGKIVAMRATLYNTETRVFEYFDFYIDKIEDKKIKVFLNEFSDNFEILDLFLYKDRLLTKVELNNKILIKELDRVKDIEDLLSKFSIIYPTLREMEEI